MPVFRRHDMFEIIDIQRSVWRKIKWLEYEHPPLDPEEKEKRIRMIREQGEADVAAVYEKCRKTEKDYPACSNFE